MADVRSMLKNERVARRIHHKHASYSTSGTLLCTLCHLQLKSELLWDGHLRSVGHLMHAQKAQDEEKAAPVDEGKKKRKASDDDEQMDIIRKRTKAGKRSLLDDFFEKGQEEEVVGVARTAPTPANEMQMKIPSRPATPLKTTKEMFDRPDAKLNVDEDEWAAFEADIALAEAQPETIPVGNREGVISAPAMTAAELKQRDAEEDYKRKREKLEAEAEGDKEDAARKLEDEFEEMESLEQRVRRLREKREALRNKESAILSVAPRALPSDEVMQTDEEDDEDDEEDDDWDGFRMKG